MARAIRDEFGAEASASSGVQAWAAASLDNSERDVHRTIRKQDLCLHLPMREMSIGDVSVPWLRPTEWLKYIVEQQLWHHLSGLQANSLQQCQILWEGFWDRFCTLNPDFELPDNFDKKNTAACYLHGDEGRTHKKQALMVLGFQSCLGLGCTVNGRSRKRTVAGDVNWQTNYRGHSFTTRFVTNVLTKKLTEAGFDAACSELAQNLRECLDTAYTKNGVTHRLCVIACKGDWPFLIRAGQLRRHFLRSTRKTANANRAVGVCHLCMAGTQGYPAEECGYLDPRWLQTMPARLPWLATPPLLQHLPSARSAPASFFEPDMWHVIHLGVGKAFCASTIILAVTNLPRYTALSNMDQRWQACTQDYLSFCRQAGRQNFINKIGASTVNYNDATGATGGWHKGSVTTNMVLWLEDLLSQRLDNAGDHRLQVAMNAARSLNEMMRFLYEAGAFLSKSETEYVSDRGRFFLRSYCDLAMACFRDGKPQLYPMLPKLHALDHVMLRVYSHGQRHGFAGSPLATACQQDEDLIGRVSRISRRVSIRTVVQRTFDRYLTASFAVWRDAGLMILV